MPLHQKPDKTLPEFRSQPHQHHPTRNEQSTFRPVAVQKQSSCIPVPRIFPDNTHGDRPAVEIEREMSRGLDTIQEEPTNTMDVTSTNEENGDLGTLYSSKWMRQLFNMAVGSGSIPKHFQDILKLSKQEQNLWIIAMEKEIQPLSEHNVWMLVDLPKGHKPIKGRWIFAVKSDGCKKAQFITKGFTQVFGIDYEEIF